VSRHKRHRPATTPHASTPAPAPPAVAAHSRPRRRSLAVATWVVGLAALLVAGALWLSRSAPGPAAPTAARAVATPSAHVDNTMCLGCHQDQARRWQGSHHAKAMAPATVDSVRGDFGDTEFRHQGVTSRFFRRDGRFFVRTDGPDGRLADFEVAYTFGWSPLQQYLIALPGGRLQALQIAWDVERRRWFHLLPDEKAPPGDVLHWTGRYQNANTMCISCHTTAFEKRYDASTDSFASRWKEVNVSCQACHGPGERHVQWAQARDAGKTAPDLPGERLGLAVSLKGTTASKMADVCAACHSRRSELTASALPGAMRLDQHLPVRLTRGLYHADGQQLDEVFVDGSYRQSRMFQMGVTCAACHDPHSAKVERAGNAVCLQCHAPQPHPSFPSAAGTYDSPSHHFHAAGSAGAQCVSCHMPTKTYMQIQPRPDHSLRVPRPDLTVKIGTPNACNACHVDKSAQWAADQVVAWYGPTRRQEPHYGEAFAASRAGQPGAAEALARLVADARAPAIVRATALDELRGASAGIAERLAATRDADAEVRTATADSLESAPPEQRVYALGPLLTDPVRAVRIAAARSLSSVPPEQLGDALRPAFDAALAEFIAVQGLALDMPGARLGLAVVYQNTGRTDLAETHYRAALKLDPDFTPARANLAQLYNALARNDEAERVLRDGLHRQPDIGDLQYSLGLLLAEQGRLPEAAAALAQAARLMPARARVHVNLGLALQQLGRRGPAQEALLTAHRLDPLDPTAPQALAILNAQGGQRAEALVWAEKFLALAPDDPQAQRLVAQLRARP
jgi:predicted CXXCH cytochrome family protein